MTPTLRPRYIALCGAPRSGKSSVANYAAEHYGGVTVDDGMVLREAVRGLYGLDWEDVYTQEGKARSRVVCGKTFTHRQLLGDLGNLLEGFYGDQIMPELALSSISGSVTPSFFLFPSCRKNQGLTYLKHGGVVIEVTRPGCEPVNDFDRYDSSLVTHRLHNTGDLNALFAKVDNLFQNEFGFALAPALAA